MSNNPAITTTTTSGLANSATSQHVAPAPAYSTTAAGWVTTQPGSNWTYPAGFASNNKALGINSMTFKMNLADEDICLLKLSGVTDIENNYTIYNYEINFEEGTESFSIMCCPFKGWRKLHDIFMSVKDIEFSIMSGTGVDIIVDKFNLTGVSSDISTTAYSVTTGLVINYTFTNSCKNKIDNT